MKSGETAEPIRRVLPTSRYQGIIPPRPRHDFHPGERVVLTSLSSVGWVFTDFHGTFIAMEECPDAMGRTIRKAVVEWDATISRAAHTGRHTLNRLRPES